MEKEEIWRDVVGLEDRYQVSNKGRVRSKKIVVKWGSSGKFRIHPLSGKIRALYKTPRGYFTVFLVRVSGEKGTHTSVHRLVCEAFNGPSPPGKNCVLHNDGNPCNNTPENLRWGDQAENAQDSIKHGAYKRGEKNHRARLSDLDVEKLRKARNEGASYPALARQFGIHHSYARNLALGLKRA